MQEIRMLWSYVHMGKAEVEEEKTAKENSHKKIIFVFIVICVMGT